MKTFSIQLILAYICLSNAKLYTEKDGNAQQQWPFRPKNNADWNEAMKLRNQKKLSNQNGWINGTTWMKNPKECYDNCAVHHVIFDMF